MVVASARHCVGGSWRGGSSGADGLGHVAVKEGPGEVQPQVLADSETAGVGDRRNLVRWQLQVLASHEGGGGDVTSRGWEP